MNHLTINVGRGDQHALAARLARQPMDDRRCLGAPEIAVEENDLDASAPKLSQNAEVQGSTRRPAKRPGLARGSHLDASQLDRLLGARLNTLAACLARRGPWRVGRLPPVRDALELAEHAELREVGVAYAADLEHVEWADLDALGLPLALPPIDDRRDSPGLARQSAAGEGRIAMASMIARAEAFRRGWSGRRWGSRSRRHFQASSPPSRRDQPAEQSPVTSLGVRACRRAEQGDRLAGGNAGSKDGD